MRVPTLTRVHSSFTSSRSMLLNILAFSLMALLLPRPATPFCRSVYQRILRGRESAVVVSGSGGSTATGINRALSGHEQPSFRKWRHELFRSFATTSENPTLEWKGSSMSTSEFANHIIVQADQAPLPVAQAVNSLLQKRREDPDDLVTELSAEELIGMGSVWFLHASAPRDPAQGTKPLRLCAANATSLVLQEDDYLRIHHYPRRFRACSNFDWSKYITDKGDGTDKSKPGVLVAEDPELGWVVIDKPAMVPVHMTVDNSQENVASCIQRARMTADQTEVPYVTTPQRLDQNTSGLLVVSTTKVFAAYYAKLLSNKTMQQLEGGHGTVESIGGIHKLYRCLICLQPPSVDEDSEAAEDAASWSVKQASAELHSLVDGGTVLRHYLEPSIRAPKRFVTEPPEGENWPECLLKIRKAGPVHALIGNQAGSDLAQSLWNTTDSLRIPPNCQAVMELEIELLTGRTHQIRGQMSAIGFPLVGDAQYGGALPAARTSIGSDQLALQCCELEFKDPDIVPKRDGTYSMKASKRWNRFRVEEAWWTYLTQRYEEETKGLSAVDATTGAADMDFAESTTTATTACTPLRPDLLPDQISLSPGKNKYVLIKARHPESADSLWFVKSATPEECGGPYHGNVAQDLREWIEAAGYQVTVTGGGRIDYRPTESVAVVYGFSYGFGKGDHEFVASLIRELSDSGIDAVHDNSDALY